MRHKLLHLAFSLLALLAGPALSHAQSDVTPLDPDFKRLPEIARRSGNLQCVLGSREEYGRAVHVVSGGAKDAWPMWVVERVACGPPEAHPDANELLVYRTTGDTIPPVESCYRVGPPEHSSITKLLTSGDLDQDGYSDLVCAIRIIGDTSFGNKYYGTSRVVVFWGHSNGTFTLDDTSRVPSVGHMWLGPSGAVQLDLGGDTSHLLILTEDADYAGDNTIVPAPSLRIFSLRHGERWGRDGVPCRAVWTMWKRPPVGIGGSLVLLDHDGDGSDDLAFYDNRGTWDSAGWVSVLYGRPNALPDSNDLQTVYMTAARGRSSLLRDITGDGVPELIVHCGNDEVCRIYIGLRGRRLLEQYGSGADTARAGQTEWWGRPWATLRLPRAFWTGWGPSDRHIYNLGDSDGDGIADIWIVSSLYLLCYTTGEWLDEYADGILDLVPGRTFDGYDYPECLIHGDIGLTSHPEVKIVGTNSGIRYLGTDTRLPHADHHVHPLPEGTGKPTTAVPGERAWPWKLDMW